MPVYWHVSILLNECTQYIRDYPMSPAERLMAWGSPALVPGGYQ